MHAEQESVKSKLVESQCSGCRVDDCRAWDGTLPAIENKKKTKHTNANNSQVAEFQSSSRRNRIKPCQDVSVLSFQASYQHFQSSLSSGRAALRRVPLSLALERRDGRRKILTSFFLLSEIGNSSQHIGIPNGLTKIRMVSKQRNLYILYSLTSTV